MSESPTVRIERGGEAGDMPIAVLYVEPISEL
jgi:hypothetical protein